MDRIVGIETEYGCLMSSEELRCNSDVWPAKVKNYLFNKARAGTIDLHYRDYEEPPGNGGFLLNRGRLYILTCHIEPAPPRRLPLLALVTFPIGGRVRCARHYSTFNLTSAKALSVQIKLAHR